MGCPQSTQAKVNPILPLTKTKNRKKKDPHDLASSRTEFVSPRQDDLLFLPGKVKTFETSPAHRFDSQSPLANSDYLKSEGNKVELPMIHINGKGVFVGEKNKNPKLTIITAEKSLNSSTVQSSTVRSPTFEQCEDPKQKQTEPQQQNNPSPPDQDNGDQDNGNNLRKMLTFGGKQATSSEEIEGSVKATPDEFKHKSSSSFLSKQDIPETPGFKPYTISPGGQNVFEMEADKIDTSILGQSNSASTRPFQDYLYNKGAKPGDKPTPSPKKEEENGGNSSNQAREISKSLMKLTKRDSEKEEPKHANFENKKSKEFSKNLVIYAEDLKDYEPDQKPKSQVTWVNAQDKKHEQKEQKEEKKKVGIVFSPKKPNFTQNLLELISPVRTDSLRNELASPIIVTGEGGSKKFLFESLNDSNGLSIRPRNITSDHKKPFLEGEMEEDQEIERGATKKRTIPFRLYGSDFVQNGETISPINNSKIGGVTPPFSNRTFYVRNFLGSGEILPASYGDYLSKGDLDKSSFSAEIKKHGLEDGDSSMDSYKETSNKKIQIPTLKPRRYSTQSIIDNEKKNDEISSLMQIERSKTSNRHKTFLDVEKEMNLDVKKAHSSPFLPGPIQTDRLGESLQIIETSRLDKSIDENGYKRINQYTLLSELGAGSFAKVKLGVITGDESGQEFALKIANKTKLKRRILMKNKNALTQLQTEIAVLKKLKHPNIVQLFEVIDDPAENKLYLVMEFAKKGAVMSKTYWNSGSMESPLSSAMLKGKMLTAEKAKKYFRDLVRGLHYMHHHANIIHRDIKPENLLVDQYDTLKITDFNISHMFKNSTDMVSDSAGTKLFMSPEAWSGASFRGKPADIWAAGATLYYFLYGKWAFQPKLHQDIKEIILFKEPQYDENIPVDPEAIRLIKACLIKDPAKRITVKELMKDPWVTDNGANPLSNEEFGVVSVTLEEIKAALTQKLQMAFIVANQLVKSLNSARSNIKSKQDLDNSFAN